MEINIYEAKTKLSQLVDRAVHGEEIIIAKAGRPLVRLVPLSAEPDRELGTAAGTISYVDGWDAPLSGEEVESFLGQ